jgi:dienelactone hydrolase
VEERCVIRLFWRALAAALVVALAAVGCGGDDAVRSSAPKPRPAPSLFAYEPSRPLDLADRGRVNKDYPIAIRDVRYTSGQDRIRAYLAVPPRHGRMPGVVYLHGSGGDRSQLVVPAGWLAARGAVTLTITTPSATAKPAAGATGLNALRWQQQVVARDVVAVRRAVDLLRRRSDVDPKRIGLVGWSGGARLGAILAGVDRRIDAFVLMSGGAVPLAEYVSAAPAEVRADVRRLLGTVDPLRLIALARPGSMLLQDGRHDAVVPRRALQALVQAAPPGTSVRWYDAGHALNKAAYRDQLAWLVRKLAIRGPAVPGARTGP